MGCLMRGLRLSLESCRTVFQGSYLLVWHPGATSAVSDPCWWISHKPPAEALPLRELEQTKQAEQTLDWRRMEILVRGSCVRKLARFFRVLQCREFVQCSSNVDILRVYVVHFVRDLHSHPSVQISVACPKSTQFIPFLVSKVAMSEVLQILEDLIWSSFIFSMFQDVSGSDAPKKLQHNTPSFSRMTKHQKRLKRWWSLGRFWKKF